MVRLFFFSFSYDSYNKKLFKLLIWIDIKQIEPPFKQIELFIVISIENKPSRKKNFFRKGLKKSVVKILFRKGLSYLSLGIFTYKGLTNPSKKGKAQSTVQKLGNIPNLVKISFFFVRDYKICRRGFFT